MFILAVTHLLGDLDIGDVSVAIAISSPHRPAAYATSRFAIEELKRNKELV
jgi:molybdopterin synthase catalytic subunit